MATPFQSQVKKIEMVNFAGSYAIDIYPQVYEIALYEGLFSPIQKVSLALYDPIGMFNNFPLIGEEIILLTFEDDSNVMRTYAYVIDDVVEITPSAKAREVAFIINLSSLTTLPNTLLNVQHAYHERVSNIIYNIFNNYIVEPLARLKDRSKGIRYAMNEAETNYFKLKYTNIEESLGDDLGTIIVPNMKPLSAIQWLSVSAVPQDNKNYSYLFWQANDGFHFETVQKLYTKNPVKRKLKYYSDAEIVKQLSLEDQVNAISNLIINNRISTLEKVTAGYYQNSLFEVNLSQLRYKTSMSLLGDMHTNIEGDKNKRTNTDNFINAMIRTDAKQGNLETSNRVKYIFNNRMDFDPITPLSNREQNWGNQVRSNVGLSQIDIHVTIMGDSSLSAGDIVEIDLPKMEGFNVGDGNAQDKFIVGKYIVTEVKQLFLTAGGVHSTVLRLNKDTFSTDPDNVKFAYGENYLLDVSGKEYQNEKQ